MNIELLQDLKDSAVLRELTAEVDRLRELNAELVESLKTFTGHYAHWMVSLHDDEQSYTYSRHTIGDIRRARALIRKAEAGS